jgi:hypothetical protein
MVTGTEGKQKQQQAQFYKWFWEKLIRLLSFHMTRIAWKTTSPKIFLPRESLHQALT